MKAAKKIAMKAVVVIWWETATAALVGVALAPEVVDPEPEAAAAEVAIVVAEVDDEAEESLELPSTAVALRFPHFRLFLQAFCPSASSGFAATHCTKV